VALPVLLYIVWMTNLYNFMDGSDGLAGGMALLGFSFYGFVGLLNGDEEFAMMNFSIGAAALGFLYQQLPSGKSISGRCGSIPLGFLAAAFGVWAGSWVIGLSGFLFWFFRRLWPTRPSRWSNARSDMNGYRRHIAATITSA